MNILQGLGSLLGGNHGGSGTIQVTVVQARRLARKDVISKSDPYCLLTIGRKHDMPLQNHIGTHFKTTVMNNNQDPVWNQTFNLSVKDSENELLRIKVYDYDHMTFDDLIGEVDIPLFNLRAGQPKDEWYQLSPAKGGAIRLMILANGFGMGAQNYNNQGMGMANGNGMGMQQMGMQAGGNGMGMQQMGMGQMGMGQMGMGQMGMGQMGMGQMGMIAQPPPLGYPAVQSAYMMQPPVVSLPTYGYPAYGYY